MSKIHVWKHFSGSEKFDGSRPHPKTLSTGLVRLHGLQKLNPQALSEIRGSVEIPHIKTNAGSTSYNYDPPPHKPKP